MGTLRPVIRLLPLMVDRFRRVVAHPVHLSRSLRAPRQELLHLGPPHHITPEALRRLINSCSSNTNTNTNTNINININTNNSIHSTRQIIDKPLRCIRPHIHPHRLRLLSKKKGRARFLVSLSSKRSSILSTIVSRFHWYSGSLYASSQIREA